MIERMSTTPPAGAASASSGPSRLAFRQPGQGPEQEDGSAHLKLVMGCPHLRGPVRCRRLNTGARLSRRDLFTVVGVPTCLAQDECDKILTIRSD